VSPWQDLQDTPAQRADAEAAAQEAPGAAPRPGPGEARRRSAAVVVQCVYRLVKACLLHNDSNQAIVSLIPAAASAIADFCALCGADAVTLVFAEEGVFANGQMLRVSREAYDSARELGAHLHACGVNELVIDKGARHAELAAFARLVADAQRDRPPGAAAAFVPPPAPTAPTAGAPLPFAERLARGDLRGVRVRNVPAPTAGLPIGDEQPLAVRVTRAYAASLLVMRAVYADLRTRETVPLDRVRRVAQKLVSLAEENPRPLLALASYADVDADEPAMAVATAVVALGVARQLTAERRTLSALVTAALLYDSGRRRLLRVPTAAALPGHARRAPLETLPPPLAIERALDDEEQARLPASAAVALTALGKLHAPALTRTVVLYEAIALRGGARRGPLYGGKRQPTLLSRILFVARAFAELRAPTALATGTARPPLEEVFRRLLEQGGSAERSIVRLLIGALGFFPRGTLVELTTGELAVVVAAAEHPARMGRPRVRVLYDALGGQLAQPFEVDLGSGAPGNSAAAPTEPPPPSLGRSRAAPGQTEPAPPMPERPRKVARIVDADAEQSRAIRATLGGARSTADAGAPGALPVWSTTTLLPGIAPPPSARPGLHPSSPQLPAVGTLPSSLQLPAQTLRPSSPQVQTPFARPSAPQSSATRMPLPQSSARRTPLPQSGATPPQQPPHTAAPTQIPPRGPARVRTAPAPLEGDARPASQPVAAAWLGKPLTQSSQAPPEVPRSAHRPPVDRAALLEKLRSDDLASSQKLRSDDLASAQKLRSDDLASSQKLRSDDLASAQKLRSDDLAPAQKLRSGDLASTQPPPPHVFDPPMVPPPPRLPGQSPRPAAPRPGPATWPAPAPGALFSGRPSDPWSPLGRSSVTSSVPPSSSAALGGSAETGTIAPPSPPPTLDSIVETTSVAPPDPRAEAPGRRPDPRREPENIQTWADALFIDEPPQTLESNLGEGLDAPTANFAWDDSPPSTQDQPGTGDAWPDLDDLPAIGIEPSPPPVEEPRSAPKPSSRRTDPRIDPDDEPSRFDDLATLGPPPPALSSEERDRLLAEYLAEISGPRSSRSRALQLPREPFDDADPPPSRSPGR